MAIYLPTNIVAAILMEIFSTLIDVTLAFIVISTLDLQKHFKSLLSTLCQDFVRKVVNINV